MEYDISHNREEETMEAKARWFQSLTIEERIEVFCHITDLALSVNPHIADERDDKQIKGRIQIISKT